MGTALTTGTVLSCTFGAAPSTYVATPLPDAPTPIVPAATIIQTLPMVNIMPFGMCSSLSNPAVSSATAAALGVLTPMPCVPVPITPWIPGAPTITYVGLPLATTNDRCSCAWGGMISVTVPACQTYKTVP